MIDILKSEQGKILISIIWGIGLSCLFRQVCKGRDCIVIRAPNPSTIKGKVFKVEKKCYQYIPYHVECKGDAIY